MRGPADPKNSAAGMDTRHNVLLCLPRLRIPDRVRRYGDHAHREERYRRRSNKHCRAKMGTGRNHRSATAADL